MKELEEKLQTELNSVRESSCTDNNFDYAYSYGIEYALDLVKKYNMSENVKRNMKSLNDIPCYGNKSIFTTEIMQFIQNEGFEYKKDDSYCYDDYAANHPKAQKYHEMCYYKYVNSIQNWTINVYIFPNGIGVDIDYSCGGNSSNWFIEFDENDENTFEKVYDEMVDSLNYYR